MICLLRSITFAFICAFAIQLSADTSARRISVDAQLSPAEAAKTPLTYSTLAAASAVLQPGDTLWIAPGSGPYREALHIKESGTPERPIIIEGNNNEITGFAPLSFDQASTPVTVRWPFVLRHKGKRILQDASTQSFTGGITWNSEAKTLTLAPGTSAQGWEISARDFVIRISGVSYHTYRNLIATGSRNDGFNIHGNCVGLFFENITGAQNLDEGFSAHAAASVEIRCARFYENDNGLLNIQESQLVLIDTDIYQNLGIGLGFNATSSIKARNVRVWGNGMIQLLLSGTASASFENTSIYQNPHTARPWASYMESARRPTPTTYVIGKTIQWTGPKPRFSTATSPES